MLQNIISDKFRSLSFLTLIMINILITKQKLQLIETEQQISDFKIQIKISEGSCDTEDWRNDAENMREKNVNYKIFLNVHICVYT